MFNRLRLWARAILLRRRLEREMQEEMAEHLEQATARLVERGLAEDTARREAVREFGNVASLQEDARDARGGGWVDALRADCRFALRHFARRLGTTITMFVVLVGGMSISTLLFTFVHAYAVAPPPGVSRADDLVRIRGSIAAGADGRGTRTFSHEELLAYQKLTNQFKAVAGWTDARVTLGIPGDAERRGFAAKVSFVTASYFSVIGVRPQLGPGLTASDAGDATLGPVAVIGAGTWERFFARQRNAIGSVVLVNGVPTTVVGVAPDDFAGFPAPDALQLWMPLAARPVVTPEPMGAFRAIGRLREGVTVDAATVAVEAVAARTAASVPENKVLQPSADVVPLLSANGDPMFERDVKLMSGAIGALALLVLLVACTNVSALLTGLAVARRQEIAIRLSLGAARGRLIRQLLTESALLATLAAATALGVVWTVIRTATTLSREFPFKIGITWTEIAFTFSVALAVGVMFGLSPALHATRLGLANVLRDSTGTIAVTRGGLQRGLVVAQIAFTQPLIVLLVAVLLFVIQQIAPRTRNEIGDRLVVVAPSFSTSFDARPGEIAELKQRSREVVRRLFVRLTGVPGVELAAIDWGTAPQLGAYVANAGERVASAPRDVIQLSPKPAGESYLELMGLRLVRGRSFARTEFTTYEPWQPELGVIIGTELARRLWGDTDAIGRRLQPATDSVVGPRSLVVVGIVDDPVEKARKRGDEYVVYVPPDTTGLMGAVILRTNVAAEPLMPTLRSAVQQVIPDRVVGLRTVQEIQDGHARNFRIVTSAIATAGLVALFLSAIGLYAVVAFSVGQRTREIAVRMAVGARGQQIVRRFTTDGIRLSAIGLALGLPASLLGLDVLMRALENDIPSVPLGAVTTIAAVAVLLVAAAAAIIPARRAAAVDPAVTLRSP